MHIKHRQPSHLTFGAIESNIIRCLTHIWGNCLLCAFLFETFGKGGQQSAKGTSDALCVFIFETFLWLPRQQTGRKFLPVWSLKHSLPHSGAQTGHISGNDTIHRVYFPWFAEHHSWQPPYIVCIPQRVRLNSETRLVHIPAALIRRSASASALHPRKLLYGRQDAIALQMDI